MADTSRPSLDVLVPLVMIDSNITNDINENNLSCEPQKEILRHFESGDLVLVKLESQCLPAIIFNVSGLVMKFDIDRQLYHVCLLDKEFTEQWVDATDMIIYSVPMIAECDNEQIMLMWSTANEILEISNNNDEKSRLEEFKRRYNETRQQQVPISPMNISRKTKRSRTSSQRTISQQIISSPLTICEELLIIDSIHRLSQCTYSEAKQIAEDTYTKIICTNNRENIQSYSIGVIPEQWFIIFAIRKIDYLQQYSTIWLADLEALVDASENTDEIYSLISLMKEAI